MSLYCIVENQSVTMIVSTCDQIRYAFINFVITLANQTSFHFLGHRHEMHQIIRATVVVIDTFILVVLLCRII